MTIEQLHNIIKGCIKQNQHCQRQLFDVASEKVMQVCQRYCPNKEEARDLFQDSFIKIFSSLDKYDNQKGEFNAWIYSITKNTVLTYLKSKRIKFDAIEEKHFDDKEWSNVNDDVFTEQDILQEIQKMPEGYRTVLNLYVFEELSHQQIAQLLQITESTSRSQIVRARNYLKNRLLKLNTSAYEKYNV